MQINWTLIACLVIGFFVIAGFSKGWWKEAIITAFLLAPIFLLQNPDVAQTLITGINDAIAWVWDILPNSITSFFNTGIDAAFVVNTSNAAPQIDAANPTTWIVFLAVLVGGAILLSRASLGSNPTLFGKLLGALLGLVNGFLILSLFREYLDGRALPGNTPPDSELNLVGTSAFGPAAQTVTVEATNLPNYTIFDSGTPWIIMGIIVLFMVLLLRTRVGIAKNDDGSKVATKVPPFQV